MTKSARSKGLSFVQEVKKILKGMGHIVEGPLYKSKWFNNRLNAVHCDLFGVFDLISFDGKSYIGHQVSTEANKSTKIKAIQGAKLPGWVWCRAHFESNKIGFKVYEVTISGEIIKKEMIYGIRGKI